MPSARIAAASLLAVVAVTPRAAADMPGPADALCTAELQQQDGSQCEGCFMSGGQPSPECQALLDRGWTERCGVGTTNRSSLFCDRRANFIEVGRGSPTAREGCGCRAAAAGGRATISPALFLTAALALWLRVRRRRAASRGPRRARTHGSGHAYNQMTMAHPQRRGRVRRT